jgi:catechol 2,3-dioxygenase
MSSFTLDPETHVSHVHLWVADLDRALAFYRDLLGLRVTQDLREQPAPRRLAFLSASGYHHHVALNEVPGASPPPPGTTGLYHLAVLYPTRAALADAVRRLQRVDWPLRQLADHGTHEAVYVSDPDGNDVELYWDRPPEQWPRDAEGRLAFAGGELDLADLLREA